VSIGGVDHPMKAPFFVLATQNRIEQEGTYPLPEAPARPLPVPDQGGLTPRRTRRRQIMRLGTADVLITIDKVLHGDDNPALAAHGPPGAV